MREIYVRKSSGYDIAIVEDGALVEYFPDDHETSADAVCIGRVERVMPGMKAAFVNIGQERCGFLPLEEHHARELPKLQTGAHVIVQIKKEAHDEKGAFLSREITLGGEFVLFSPFSKMVAISSRIKRDGIRKEMKALGQMIAGDSFGLVIRHAALSATEDEIRAEVSKLREQWEQIRRAAATAHVPSVLFSSRSPLEIVLDDYNARGIDCIHTNDAALADKLSSYAPVNIMGDQLFDIARITNQLAAALERRVWLKSGGNIVFDPCEALTVIDVNTARFTGKTAHEETVLQTNLEACREVVRQIRLRNISGIIIVDMIDMSSRNHHLAVLEELNRAFATDRIKTVVHGFTSLGLVEISRRRSRIPLREALKAQTQQLEE